MPLTFIQYSSEYGLLIDWVIDGKFYVHLHMY